MKSFAVYLLLKYLQRTVKNLNHPVYVEIFWGRIRALAFGDLEILSDLGRDIRKLEIKSFDTLLK